MADERDEPGEEQEPAEGVKIVDDEGPALRFGPDDTGPLPHWTEPPTGEVPTLRPIALSPALLIGLDKQTQDNFLALWRSSLGSAGAEVR